ncbi:IclR family transcriptional regulator [Actinomadura sp. NBRC 104412]|uniref:IclR family transcriptional regulator n=1 Tax=Actinomadura sp. NBRC 104412 TaxID=3032203 RepID=UPI0024A2A58F|nr:IclR family transcriptional regulator [Actinomadura sp. NBRC 104412]GLZ09497.1 IclR family transcriptional regulator [Actinomadura sp. NBRC 104412]
MTEEKRSVLRRALRILETIKDAADGLSLSEISRRSGVPLTTTHRIVAELLAWGALERDDSGEYRIGLWLWEVAAVAPRSVGLQRVAQPFMRDLFETTQRGVHLAVREKDQYVFLERLLSPETATDRAQVGGRYELYATAIGLVLLAYAPPELQEKVVTGPLEVPSWHAPVTEHQVRQTLADVRLHGYATTDIRQEYTSVAAPIHGPGGTVVAALSLILRRNEPYAPRLAHLLATVRGISRALGAPQARPRPGVPYDTRVPSVPRSSDMRSSDIRKRG